MPTLKKILSKFGIEDRRMLEVLIEKIAFSNWRSLDIKKLIGYEDIFRLRKGKIRIIFRKYKLVTSILNIERRKETTYKL